MITVVLGGRAAGKTHQMIEWMKAAPEGVHRIHVSHDKRTAMEMLRQHPELSTWQFVSVDEISAQTWSGVLAGRGGRIELGLDNVELMFSRWLMWPVAAVSTTPWEVIKV